MVVVSDTKKRKLGTSDSISDDVSPKKRPAVLSKSPSINVPLKGNRKDSEQVRAANDAENEVSQKDNPVVVGDNDNEGQEDDGEMDVEEEEDEQEEEEDIDEDIEEEDIEEEDIEEEGEEDIEDVDEEEDYIDEIEMIQEPRDVRRKIPIKYIENRTRRQVTFAKRRHGIMKKAYELSVLTGANILLLILGHSGLVYTFSTPKLVPIIRENTGKQLIRSCLNSYSSSPSSSNTPGDS